MLPDVFVSPKTNVDILNNLTSLESHVKEPMIPLKKLSMNNAIQALTSPSPLSLFKNFKLPIGENSGAEN